MKGKTKSKAAKSKAKPSPSRTPAAKRAVAKGAVRPGSKASGGRVAPAAKQAGAAKKPVAAKSPSVAPAASRSSAGTSKPAHPSKEVRALPASSSAGRGPTQPKSVQGAAKPSISSVPAKSVAKAPPAGSAAPKVASQSNHPVKTPSKTPPHPKQLAAMQPKPGVAAAGRTPVKPTAKTAPAKPVPAKSEAPTKTAKPAESKSATAVAEAPAPAAPVQGGKASKKPKPPAKTMSAPPPQTEVLLKRELPDVRRVAGSVVSSDAARGIALPNQAPKPSHPDRLDEPPVDAKLIAASLAADARPQIEDNYDYSVLDEFAKGGHCPSPTRMVNTGCAGGEAAVYFAKRGFNVVGIDSDRTAVGLARERAWLAGAEIDFMVGDLFETPNLLPAESFGLAVDRGAFYRFAEDRDRQRYLGNVKRLLFKGGIFLLSAGFFVLPDDDGKTPKRKPNTKLLLVREGGVVVNEIRQAGFELVQRVLRVTADSGDFGELILTLRK